MHLGRRHPVQRHAARLADAQVDCQRPRHVRRGLLDDLELRADKGHGDADGAPTVVEAGTPTDDVRHALLQTVIPRPIKTPTRQRVPIEEIGQSWLADPDRGGEAARTLQQLHAAAVTCRCAFGPRTGQKVLTLGGASVRPHPARRGAGRRP